MKRSHALHLAMSISKLISMPRLHVYFGVGGNWVYVCGVITRMGARSFCASCLLQSNIAGRAAQVHYFHRVT